MSFPTYFEAFDIKQMLTDYPVGDAFVARYRAISRDEIFAIQDAQFKRLWVAQVVSALGDWLGFLAVVVLASRLGSGSPGTSVGLVMAARIIPSARRSW